MSVVSVRVVKVAAYLAFVGGLGALCLRISAFAGETALALAAPLLSAPAKPAITLVERRRLALEERVAVVVEKPVIPVPDRPVPLPELASAMDKAEQTDLIGRPKAQPRLRKAKRRAEVRVAAADVFGQSFGVMLRVSR